MPLLWAMFSVRCVPSVYRYRQRRACHCSWSCSLSVDTSSWLFFGCGAAFIPPPWCVFGFGSALLCCVPVPRGVVRSCVSVSFMF
jgi:hypothetical protein